MEDVKSKFLATVLWCGKKIVQGYRNRGGTEVIIAFIMAKVESTKSRVILDQVKKLDQVEEAYLIYGAYDLLIKCVFKTPEDLSSFVVNDLREVDGVKDTITNVCATCE